jgi:hypothetical protein
MIITMNAIVLLTNSFTKLKEQKKNIVLPSHLDGFTPEKEVKRAKITKELESYSTLDVAAP